MKVWEYPPWSGSYVCIKNKNWNLQFSLGDLYLILKDPKIMETYKTITIEAIDLGDDDPESLTQVYLAYGNKARKVEGR